MSLRQRGKNKKRQALDWRSGNKENHTFHSQNNIRISLMDRMKFTWISQCFLIKKCHHKQPCLIRIQWLQLTIEWKNLMDQVHLSSSCILIYVVLSCSYPSRTAFAYSAKQKKTSKQSKNTNDCGFLFSDIKNCYLPNAKNEYEQTKQNIHLANASTWIRK